MQPIQMTAPPATLVNVEQTARPGTPVSKELATEFESLVIGQLLKTMRSSSEEGGMFPGDKSDTYGGMFDMYFGRFLSENGGLGLADFVNQGLEQS